MESDKDPVLPDSVEDMTVLGGNAGDVLELLLFLRKDLFFTGSSGGLSLIASLIELLLSTSPTIENKGNI